MLSWAHQSAHSEPEVDTQVGTLNIQTHCLWAASVLVPLMSEPGAGAGGH